MVDMPLNNKINKQSNCILMIFFVNGGYGNLKLIGKFNYGIHNLHIKIFTLEMYEFQLFSLQLWINSRAD